MHENRQLGLFAACLAAFLAAVSAQADGTDACSTFRLDHEAGNPFNPYATAPLPKAAHDVECQALTEPGQMNACTHSTVWAKGASAPRNADYVAVRDQGADGNCFAQSTAGLINYRRAKLHEKPDVSPDYMASQDCGWALPPGGSSPLAAADEYNQNAGCDLSAIMGVERGNASRAMSIVSDEFDALGAFSGDRASQLKCAARELGSRFAKANKDAGADGLFPPSFIGSMKSLFTSTFSDASSGASNLWGLAHYADKELRPLADKEAAVKIDQFGIPMSPLERAASIKTQSDEILEHHVAEIKRCQVTFAILGEYCKTHPETNQQKLALTADKLDDSLTGDEEKTCALQIARTAVVRTAELQKQTLAPDEIEARAQQRAVAMGYQKTIHENPHGLLSATCAEPLLKARHMSDAFDRVKSADEPVIVDVADVTALMASAVGGATPLNTRGDSGHSMLLIGREKNASGQCGYWMRNSWGADCQKNLGGEITSSKDYDCDPATGNIWMSASLLSSRGGVAQTYNSGASK